MAATSATADTAAPAPLLSMRGIRKSFAGIPAIADGTLEIAPGEVHALIGQNGAGKSSMIKVLNGAYRRDEGEILFAGQPVSFTSPHDAQLGGISTIFQEVNLVGYRSVAENICLGHEPKRWGMIDWKAANARAREVLARFEIDIDVTRPLRHYNIALQQMVAIARAVSFDARLVIMDEPTSSLDDNETEVLFRVINNLKASGVSVLYVSHHLDELFRICDSVTIMRDGRTIARHRMSEVTKLGLIAAMLGRDASELESAGLTGFSRAARAPGAEVVRTDGLGAGTRLKSADLAVREGEIVGLAGLLGSGRTEILRALFGLDAHERGSIHIAGGEINEADPRLAIAAGFALCPEDRKIDGIVPGLSVRENLTLALLPRLARRGVLPEGEERKLVESYIGRLGIKTADMDQPIRELSGGNQQKVLLARWMAMQPKLLMLDEPTRGIDVGAKHEIQTLIRQLADRGLAVLMVSSEFEELVEGGDRVIVVHEGRTVEELDGDGLSEDALLRAVAIEVPPAGEARA
ncbi:sugar ABC transporter ATP-binding protein [Radicibacter daui]|uniref:sugar ABC transporter ATP-binding protein n=1 Tax=Radicibacter daui TaxID=3064829 RepID=UPI004046D925